MTIQEAAPKVPLPEQTLEEWESSIGLPTARRLEKFADLYKRPIAAFFLSAPPTEPPLPIDFRTRLLTTSKRVSPKTVFTVRRARRLQRVFTEIAAPHEAALFGVSAGPSDDPSVVASSFREKLGIGLGTQFTWKDAHKALHAWRSALENAGILVFQFGMPVKDTSGFSLAGDVPVVVLNRSDTAFARIFTLFHEVGHILLGAPGICLPGSGVTVKQANAVEVFCNHFAGHLTVPRDALLAQEEVRGLERGGYDVMPVLDGLSRRFSMSRHVMLRRLLVEHVISISTHNEVYRKLPHGVAPKRTKMKGENSAQRAVREIGTPVVAAVCEALDRGTVGYPEALSYLSIGLRHLDMLHEQLPA